MKTKIYVFFTGLMLFAVLQSCKKKDAENLVPVNEISISGIENKYTLLSTDVLEIAPKLSASIQTDLDNSNYDFYWINMGVTSLNSTSQDTLARTKDLSTVLGLKTGQYKLFFRMVDKKTGVFYAKSFLVNISSALSRGFLLLSEVNGGSRLDMLAKTSTGYNVVTDVLAKSASSLVLTGKPYFVSSIVNPFYGDQTFIGTSDGTNLVAEETFAAAPSSNIVYQFKGTIPSVATFKPTMFYQGPQYGAYLYNEHDIYATFLMAAPFSTPINNIGTGNVKFPASPFIANYMSTGYESNAIIFDEQGQTFYNYKAESLGASAMPTGNLFDFNVKKKLVYMGFSLYNSGEVSAILKDNDKSVYHFARFAAPYKNIAFGYQYTYQVMNATDIDKATHFAVTPQQGYLFYAVEGKLYEYDFASNSAKLMKDYGSRKISMLKVNLPDAYWIPEEYSNLLMIATYDEGNMSTSGKIEFFKTAPVQGDLELYSSYTGMGKVVSALQKY
ncbi:PKD-like family lipoprotein [Pedobacter nyackensis]|uniref:PKD-like family lipoprotein n=1 Tax=Pedobacter nyackensis TaxID=475255 RepID=UPI0029304BA3|nr:PKD-like family lipoprotein [Pedobacter nyackensis]